jgi:SAM-dependent methyltransferase
MITQTRNCEKTYIRVPSRRVLTPPDKIVRATKGSLLSPVYWLLAQGYRLPGLRFGIDSLVLGIRSLLGKNGDISYADIYRMLFWPVESTRYFEFGSAWRFLSRFPISRYLDVSSPRLFPITVLIHKREATADLLNPDDKDLQLTTGIVRARGLESRCRLWNCLLEEAPLEPASFDAITSISVVEHIPRDQEAIRRMWELLRPGGRLVLSVPCAAIAEEQYVDADHFGLQQPDANGFFFLQYVYDDSLLQERFYRVIGSPTQFAIYGEREPGSLLQGLLQKWSGATYPKWKEPYLMARDFHRYDSLQDLPGEGVIVMEFDKK